MTRIILGFLIAPLASGLLQSIVMGSFRIVIVIWIFAYAFSFILGVPAFLIFHKYSWLKLWQVIVAGTALGVIVGLLFSLIAGFNNQMILSNILGLGLFGLHGLVVSLAFWIVAFMKVGSNKSLQPTANAPAELNR